MIKLENINKKLDNNNILNNISLNINKGDVFGIVGYSGAGKSTLLKIISGFLKPDSGNLYIDNILVKDDNNESIVKNTSMIFQNYNLLNNINVLDNVLLPMKIRNKVTELDINKALDLLSFVGMLDKKDNYIKTLSGGEKQRVAIARALITDPKIILCDEPTSALDRKNSNIILKLLKEINQKYHTTIVLVSHDIDIIKTISNKVLIIDEGNIIDILEITPKNILDISYKKELLND